MNRMLYGPPEGREADGFERVELGADSAATGEASPAASTPADFSRSRRPIFESSMNGSFELRFPSGIHQGAIQRRQFLGEDLRDEVRRGSKGLQADLHHAVAVAPRRLPAAEPEQGLAESSEDDIHPGLQPRDMELA